MAAFVAFAPIARAEDQDSALLSLTLQSQFLAGIPHRVKAAEAVGGGPLGFVVEVPVKREDADEGRHRARLERLRSQLTANALSVLARTFPGRPVASWSTVDLVEEEGQVRPPPPARHVDLTQLDALVAGRGRIADPRLGAPPMPADVRAADRVAPLEGTLLASLAPSMADRLRRELAPLYPDARVEVKPAGRGRVKVWVTVLTTEPTPANGPIIVDYVKRLVEIVVSRDYPGVEMVGGPNIGVRPIDDPDGDDLPRRDNGDWRSRQPIDRKGLSRELEGRLRQELSARFLSLVVTVSFVNPHEAIFEIRGETKGALTPENAQSQREFMRRTVLTILGNEHPDILPSARSKFSVWTKTRGTRRVRTTRSAGVGIAAPLTALRARVVELPTAHVLHQEKRQYEAGVYQRAVGGSFFSNIVKYNVTGLDLAYRQGLVRSVEGALTYHTQSSAVSVIDPTTFTGSSTGQGVLSASLKVNPFRYNGIEFSLGGTQSLVSDLDTAHLLPDEWEKFSNVYAVLSAPFAPGFRTSLVALDGFIPKSGTGSSASVLVLGAAVEWAPLEELRLAGEVVQETLNGSAIGELGAPLKDATTGKAAYDNVHGNLSATAGFHGLGDVSVYARKFNLSAYREFGLSLAHRF